MTKFLWHWLMVYAIGLVLACQCAAAVLLGWALATCGYSPLLFLIVLLLGSLAIAAITYRKHNQ
jgi:hypothetical protein